MLRKTMLRHLAIAAVAGAVGGGALAGFTGCSSGPQPEQGVMFNTREAVNRYIRDVRAATGSLRHVDDAVSARNARDELEPIVRRLRQTVTELNETPQAERAAIDRAFGDRISQAHAELVEQVRRVNAIPDAERMLGPLIGGISMFQ